LALSATTVYAERDLDEGGSLITMMLKEITTAPFYLDGDSKNGIYPSEMALTTEIASTRLTRAGSTDLQPLVNTTWQFTYTVGTTTYTDTISCGSNTTTTSDGTVMLLCTDSQNNPTRVTYVPTAGAYAMVIINVLKDSFAFKLQGCCSASGAYYVGLLDVNFQHPYPLTGTRTNPPIPSGTGTHPPVTRDFDGDGKDDILWYNKATGGLFLYTSSKGDYPTEGVPVDTGWVPVGVFDYDKDGQADILWWNQKTGEAYVWLGNKTKGSIGFVPDTQWQPCCGGDLDGNGFGDILWFNQTTGGLYVWYDDKQRKVPYGGVDPKSGWLPKGVADFDGDGRGDILWWSQQNGGLTLWTTKNGNYPLSGVPIATGWMVAGVGDFDGDGTPDILWWNQQTGEVYIWDNGGKGPHHSRGLVADLNWSPL
jgi:hypothetical protein